MSSYRATSNLAVIVGSKKSLQGLGPRLNAKCFFAGNYCVELTVGEVTVSVLFVSRYNITRFELTTS